MNQSAQERRGIILANNPRLLRGMLKRVLQNVPDLVVVGETSDSKGLLAMIEQTNAKWIVLSLPVDGKIPEEAETILSVHPNVFVLAVAADGSRVKVKWRELYEKELKGLVLDDLMAVLRHNDLVQ